MLTVSITDAQWDKWGQPGGWTMWKPDTQPEHFCPNLAVVLCKGVFDDATDPGLMGKVCHYMTIARVPDCVELLPFNQVREAFNWYNEATTRVGLVQLHQSNETFPDIYFQYYGEHFTIMGLSDPEIRFDMADEFVGGYLVCRHVAASGRRAHATDSMKPGTPNLKGIAEMTPPANYTEVQRFLGMTGFFRRFIKNYARIAKPLNDILEGEASKMKSEAVILPLEALEVFEQLKMCCMMAPVLAFADFEKEFQLETDASSEGLGAVLSQKQPDGKWHPIAFGSHELKGGEAKYHSSKLEFLALKWAIMEQFREYLQY